MEAPQVKSGRFQKRVGGGVEWLVTVYRPVSSWPTPATARRRNTAYILDMVSVVVVVVVNPNPNARSLLLAYLLAIHISKANKQSKARATV